MIVFAQAKTRNLTDDGTQLYKYDYRNNLIEVRRKSDGMVLGTYKPDALGRRSAGEFWNAPSGGYRSQLYVNDGWQVSSTYELIATETLFSRTVFGNGIDEPLMLEVLDVHDVDGDMVTDEYLKYYYHRDTLGTITHVTNIYGEIVERYECTPFGKTTIYTGTGPDGLWNTADDLVSPFGRVENPYIFQGRELDEESGLYYFRTRHYAPNEGRFVQRDGPGDWFDEGNLGNGYNFVHSNPIQFIDPFGLESGPSPYPGVPVDGLPPGGLWSPGLPTIDAAPFNDRAWRLQIERECQGSLRPGCVQYYTVKEILSRSPWRRVISSPMQFQQVGPLHWVARETLVRDVTMRITIYVQYSLPNGKTLNRRLFRIVFVGQEYMASRIDIYGYLLSFFWIEISADPEVESNTQLIGEIVEMDGRPVKDGRPVEKD